MKNKKGSVFDIIMIAVALFSFAVITLISVSVYNQYKEELTSNPVFNDSTSNAYVEGKASTTFAIFDYLFSFILVGLIIMVVVSSFSIRSHPLFFFISMLLLVIVVIIANILSQVYTEIAGEQLLATTADTYTIIPFIMGNLATFILIIGAILVVLLYGKSKYEEN